MKRLSLIASLVFFSLYSFAQDSTIEKKAKASVKHKMNIVKINLAALPLRTYGFQYERVLNKRFSISVGYRNMPNGSLPLQSTIIRLGEIEGDSAAESQIRSLQISNIAITPEIRIYLGRKGYGRGFYFSPFYRNASFNASGIEVEYRGATLAGKKTILSGKIAGNSFGLQLGAQWSMGKKVSLDWWIIGPHYGTSNGEFKGVITTPLTATEQTDLKKELEALQIPLVTKTVNVTANSATVTIGGPFAGIRAGVCLGVKF